VLLIGFLSETSEVAVEKPIEGSVNRGEFVCHCDTLFLFMHFICWHYVLIPTPSLSSSDAVLAKVATEKRLSLIKAWEESEKSKAENK